MTDGSTSTSTLFNCAFDSSFCYQMSINKYWLKFSVILMLLLISENRLILMKIYLIFTDNKIVCAAALGGKFSSPALPTSMNIAHDSAAVVLC